MKDMIEKNFVYHTPKEGQPERYTQLRSSAKELAMLIDALCPDSREKSLASIKNLITSYGTFKVMYDPLLSGSVYGGYGYALDVENIRYTYLKGRDTKLRTGIQANDKDGVVDEYLTECSLEVRLPKTHVKITGAHVLD